MKKVMETLCPDEDQFVRLQQGELPEQERASLMAHIDACPSCSELLFMLTELEGEAAPFHSEELLPSASKRPLMIGRYEVIEQAGVGGLGVVYKARDTRLDRVVAVKLLRPDVLATRPEQADEATQRLQREARALARHDHPHIVTIHDMDRHGDQFFIACAFIDGGNLRDWSRARNRHWREVVALCLQVARALVAAHAEGIVHRDVKPENVLLRQGSDHALLTDFGMATLPLKTSTTRFATDELATQQGMILGTPAYMSPEQLDGQSATPASDQFSFCVMLYEALYGFRPYHATDYQELLQVLKRGELVKPSSSTIPDEVFEVLAEGLRPMPGERHEEMATLTSKLEALIEQPEGLDTTREARRRPPTAILIASAAFIALAMGAMALFMSQRDASPARRVTLLEGIKEEVLATKKGEVSADVASPEAPTRGAARAPRDIERESVPPDQGSKVTNLPMLHQAAPSPGVSSSASRGAKRKGASKKRSSPPAALVRATPTVDLAQRVRDTYEDRRAFSLAVLRYDGKACKKHHDRVVAVLPDWEFAAADNLFRLRCEYLRGECKLASEFERLLPNQLVPMDARQIARHNLMYAHPSCLKSTTEKLRAASHHALDACTNPMREGECDTRMKVARKLIEEHPGDAAIVDREVHDSISWVLLEVEEAKKKEED